MKPKWIVAYVLLGLGVLAVEMLGGWIWGGVAQPGFAQPAAAQVLVPWEVDPAPTRLPQISSGLSADANVALNYDCDGHRCP